MSVRPAKTQISLGIRPVWSETSLSAWRKHVSLATHWAHREDSGQTGRMPRLIWIFAGRTVTLLVLSCRDSIISWFGFIPYNWRDLHVEADYVVTSLFDETYLVTLKQPHTSTSYQAIISEMIWGCFKLCTVSSLGTYIKVTRQVPLVYHRVPGTSVWCSWPPAPPRPSPDSRPSSSARESRSQGSYCTGKRKNRDKT